MKNKFIKTRKQFLNESSDIIKPNALDILAQNDEGQNPELKNVIDKLDDQNTGESNVRTRFAPSPTGKDAHIGSLKTALINYLFAKQNNGIMYFRLEDTDQKRFVEGSEEAMRKSLEWCGIEFDEAPWKPNNKYGPYRQSERDYSKHVKYLLDNGFAYYAFDTEEDIEIARKKTPNFTYDARTRSRMKNSLSLPKEEVDELMKSGYVIRFKVEPGVDVTCDDIVMGPVTINTKRMDDKVLVKSNGIPTYTLASVCDDHDMKTSHVIRGSEWLPSAPFHVMLYQAFGWTPPKFAHLPLLLNPEGKGKLSKRHALKYGFPVFAFGGEGTDEAGNKVNYKGFKEEGYYPEAVLNFLAILGWSPGNDKEIMSIAEMISLFDLTKVGKTGAKFDIKKAEWVNQEHLKGKPTIELLKHIEKGSSYSYPEDKLKKIVELAKERSVFAKDMQVIADIFFKPVVLNDEQKSTIIPEYKTLFSEFVKEGGPSDWKAASLRQYITDLCAGLNIKMSKVMPYLRLALAGGVSGPDLMITSEILGKEETLKRIQNSL